MHPPVALPSGVGLPTRFDPIAALDRSWRANRPLTAVGGLMLLTLAAALVGLVVDPRAITGAPAWLKPAKFALSIAIYAFTFVWLLGFVRGRRRLVAAVAWGTAGALALEQAVIAGQALRGTTSHYNDATPLDAALFSAMGIAIVAVWLLNLLLAVLLLRQRLPDAAFAWSLRWGLLVSLVGMALAFAMTSQGAHAVGVADGGPGLPIVGWSTEGGDLRVAHFVGLHALQALPLAAWAIGRLLPGPAAAPRRAALVTVVALGYLGLVLLLAWQALRGQPLLAPDAATLAAAGLLAGAVAVGVAAAVAWPGRRPASSAA